MNVTLAQTVRNRYIVTFWYHGLRRTVEPHTYGIHRDSGSEVLSGYQTAGFSNSADFRGGGFIGSSRCSIWLSPTPALRVLVQVTTRATLGWATILRARGPSPSYSIETPTTG